MNYPVVKNECYELDITAIGAEGEGIGRINGYTLFVDGAIPGDVVEIKIIKVKKNYGVGRLMTIRKASKDRVEPICPIAKQCGGCSLQHMSYEAQLRYKSNHIKDALVRLGGFSEAEILQKMEPILGQDEPYYYRNKVQYPVRQSVAGIQIGFYAKHSHRIIETDRCYIQDVYNEKIIDVVRQWMIDKRISGYNEEKHKGMIRHIMIRKSYVENKFYLVLVTMKKEVPDLDKLVERLQQLERVVSLSLNINRQKTNVIMGNEIISVFGPSYMEDNIGAIKYQISPLSFYQVNPEQTEKLYNKALEYADLTGNETVYDLYCGIGSISLFLAQKAKVVYGVEIIEAAILDARENAVLNDIKNAHFYVGKAEEVMPKLYKEENIVADVVVVDPPRKGCEESLLKAIIEMSPQKVVYVSCDPGTLSRDLKYLRENNYEVDKICGCDMFGQSTHVETVVKMSQVK